jgi:hypothetical protein
MNNLVLIFFTQISETSVEKMVLIFPIYVGNCQYSVNEEYKVKVFRNKFLRKMFGSSVSEVGRQFAILCKEKLCY